MGMFDNLFNLRGKTVLITGSTRGLGYIMAKGLGSAGARIILNGRNAEKLEKSVDELRKEGFNVNGYAFDITKKQEICEKMSLIEKEIGSIDVLVNNAGIQKRALLIEMEESLWREVIETNLTGAFLVSQQAAKGMIARKSGKVINVCSVLSELGRATIAPYAAAKGGLKMLTKSMAVEWARYNIQVNGIGPGYIITDMTRSLAENTKFDQWLKNRTPAHRWGQPEELIGTLIFLASQASNFVNGQIIYVDGGILASI
jgi:gluconate 5-dehydrogenase